METPEANSLCARCQAAFRCGSKGNDARCHCDGVTLSAETLAYLRQRYTGCLCPACLLEFVDFPSGADGKG